jgi:hypothetical protein
MICPFARRDTRFARACRTAALLLICLGRGSPAAADLFMPVIDPAMACKLAIRGAESRSTIPPQLLAAIGRVESGRRDPATGGMAPWPWTINAEGEGHFFDTKAQAIAAVRALQARGVRSIDVGCLQVNLMHHPDAFASLEQAFDPTSNAIYAAQFLTELHDQLGTWPRAAAAYHSQTPELGDDYQRRVMAAWPEERQAAGNASPTLGGLGAYAAAPIRPFPMMTGAVSAGAVYNGGHATFTLNNSPAHAHIIPLAAAAGGGIAFSHGLDFYRSRPITMATR